MAQYKGYNMKHVIIILSSILVTSIAVFAGTPNRTYLGGVISSEEMKIVIVCNSELNTYAGTVISDISKCKSISFLRIKDDGSYSLSRSITVTTENLNELTGDANTSARNFKIERYGASLNLVNAGQKKMPVTQNPNDPINLVGVPLAFIYMGVANPLAIVGDLLRAPYVFVTNEIDDSETSSEATQANLSYLINSDNINTTKQVSEKEFEIMNWLGFGYKDAHVIEEGSL